MLSAFFESENSLLDVTYPELITGLSRKIAVKIASVVGQIETEEDLRTLFSNVVDKYRPQIWAVILHCKSSSEQK